MRTHFNYDTIYQYILEKGLDNIEHEFTHDEINLFELTLQTCLKDMFFIHWEGTRKIFSLFKQKRIDLNPNVMERVAPTLEATLAACDGIFKGKNWDCHRGFGRILTEEGVCYTFNMLNKTELLHDG